MRLDTEVQYNTVSKRVSQIIHVLVEYCYTKRGIFRITIFYIEERGKEIKETLNATYRYPMRNVVHVVRSTVVERETHNNLTFFLFKSF